MLLRRDGGGDRSPRATFWKVTLFFVAAALWFTGVLLGNDLVTLAALVLLVLGLVATLVLGRRGPDGE